MERDPTRHLVGAVSRDFGLIPDTALCQIVVAEVVCSHQPTQWLRAFYVGCEVAVWVVIQESFVVLVPYTKKHLRKKTT